MAQLKEVLEGFNFHTFVYSLFLLLASLIFIYETVKKVCSIFGIKFKYVEDKDRQAQEIEGLKIKLTEIEKESINHDKALEKQLNDLTKIVIDDRIDRMRYEILDMASAISESKRWYSVEQLKHTLKIYDEYEKFLKDHNMENGEVDISIQVIQQAYRSKYSGMGAI